jgi:tetratricopeptide (TPR) repeat protein
MIPNEAAWVLATSGNASQRNGIKAVEFAQQANELSGGKVPAILDTLGAAYAEQGNYQAAVAAAIRALELAKSANDTELAAQIEQRLERYRLQEPYRQPSK